MPELIRFIANRFREFLGNRRRAARHVTHLEAGLVLSVSLSNTKTSAGEQPLKLAGYTRDISETGLALIVPTVRIGGHHLANESRLLQIRLAIPSGPITIYATPVRYAPLEEEAADTGYLIGVHIKTMSEDDRARFNDYLKMIASNEGKKRTAAK
ncbi:MAG TPA: PilZ domain-containing protein [Pyrinomonadaceae bacterium]